MTRYLPDNLLVLFKADPPIPYLSPIEKKSSSKYDGVASYLSKFEDPSTLKYSEESNYPLLTYSDLRERRREKRYKEELQKIDSELKKWDPHNNPKATKDPYNTIFVGRLNYKTTEETLMKEFGRFGPIKMIRIVHDLNGKPRGYAFIEFEDERHMKDAYMKADGMDIDGRYIIVDVERGRTVENWRPRRLGGNHGSTRVGGDDLNVKRRGRHKDGEVNTPAREDSSRGYRRDRDYRGDRDYRDRDHRRSRDYRDRDRGRYDRDRYGDRDRDRERDRDRGKYYDRDRYSDRRPRDGYRPY